MTNKAIITEYLAEPIHYTVVHWLCICQCLLNPQVTHAAISLVDDIKDVKHVAHNAISFFMNEDNHGHSVGCLGFLKSDVTTVIVALFVVRAECLNLLDFKIVGWKIFKNGIVPPVGETQNNIIVLLDRFDRIIRWRIPHQESRRIAIAMPSGLIRKAFAKNNLQCCVTISA